MNFGPCTGRIPLWNYNT